MKKYIRVETIKLDTMKSWCGYASVIPALLAVILGVKPTDIDDAEKMLELVNSCENMEVAILLDVWSTLGQIPQPEIYINDREQHYCLYDMDYFIEIALDPLMVIGRDMKEYMPGFFLDFKEFDLKKDEILYNDSMQIVISKETYEKHKKIIL